MKAIHWGGLIAVSTLLSMLCMPKSPAMDGEGERGTWLELDPKTAK
jgi:hypothetical protein